MGGAQHPGPARPAQHTAPGPAASSAGVLPTGQAQRARSPEPQRAPGQQHHVVVQAQHPGWGGVWSCPNERADGAQAARPDQAAGRPPLAAWRADHPAAWTLCPTWPTRKSSRRTPSPPCRPPPAAAEGAESAAPGAREPGRKKKQDTGGLAHHRTGDLHPATNIDARLPHRTPEQQTNESSKKTSDSPGNSKVD